MSDYLKSGIPNYLIKTEADYCDLLLAINDPEIWRNEWERCKLDFVWYCRHWVWIEHRETKETVRFIFNDVQREYWQNKTSHNIILKARKLGFSTLELVRAHHKCNFIENTKAVFTAHDADSSETIFKTARRVQDLLPPQLKATERFNNRREIELINTPFGRPLNTVFRVITASSRKGGIGIDIDILHLSEYALYQDIETVNTGLMNALRGDAEVTIESTARGYNHFYDEWQKANEGNSDYKPFFVGWWRDRDYVKPPENGEKIVYDSNEQKLIDSFGLTKEQILWYRWKQRQPGMREMIKQEFPSTPEEAFLESGNCVFDKEKLSVWLELAKINPPVHTCLEGKLQIFKCPQNGREYVIGVDTAEHESATGNDSAAIVRDKKTWEHCATFHVPGWYKSGILRHEGVKQEFTKEKYFTKLVERLGYMYNQALVAIESNKGRTHLSYMKDWQYPFLYKHKDFDQSGKVQKKLGFNTNAKTRPLLKDGGNEAIDENLINIRHVETIRQYMTFVWHDDGSFKAQDGKKDDLVFADLICLYVLKHKPIEPKIRVLA